MFTDSDVLDALATAARKSKDIAGGFGIVGFGVVEKFDRYGRRTHLEPFANLVTTAGDQYYAQKAIVGIAPASPSAPTAMNGMKLGTGTTAVAKSGAGAALVTYLTASNVAFDATFPSAAAVAGTDTGWNATYKTTWAAGVATSATINEVVIVNDQATNATSTAANSIARAVISTVNKGASDSLAITWSHKFLGA
jgi:hypothetical protein